MTLPQNQVNALHHKIEELELLSEYASSVWILPNEETRAFLRPTPQRRQVVIEFEIANDDWEIFLIRYRELLASRLGMNKEKRLELSRR